MKNLRYWIQRYYDEVLEADKCRDSVSADLEAFYHWVAATIVKDNESLESLVRSSQEQARGLQNEVFALRRELAAKDKQLNAAYDELARVSGLTKFPPFNFTDKWEG